MLSLLGVAGDAYLRPSNHTHVFQTPVALYQPAESVSQVRQQYQPAHDARDQQDFDLGVLDLSGGIADSLLELGDGERGLFTKGQCCAGL